jgi:hypothetical protein
MNEAINNDKPRFYADLAKEDIVQFTLSNGAMFSINKYFHRGIEETRLTIIDGTGEVVPVGIWCDELQDSVGGDHVSINRLAITLISMLASAERWAVASRQTA